MSLTEREREVWPETERLAKWAVRMCRRRMPLRWYRANVEDIYQVARIKAWEAQRDWREGQGRKFDSFVLMYVEREIVRMLRDWSTKKRGAGNDPFSLEDVRNEQGECITDSLAGDTGDHLGPLLIAEDARLIRAAVRYLEPAQRYAIEAHFLRDLPYEVAAQERGCKVPTLRAACGSGMAKLRSWLLR